MSVLKAFQKQSVERKKYVIDYECWLEDAEVLSDFAIRVMPATSDYPLIAGGAYVDPAQQRVAVFLSGGKPGQIYSVDFIVTTSIGQIKSDTIQMRVV